MFRKRKLSDGGKYLIRVGMTHVPSKKKIRKFLCSTFTTEYDRFLENMNNNLTNSSYHLLYLLKNDEKVSDYINNIINNIILLIFLNDKGDFANHHTVTKNYRTYADICYRAYDNKDYNTAILITAALTNVNIYYFDNKKKQPKIKPRKKDIEMKKILKDTCGVSLNNFVNHYKSILKKDDIIPCSFVLSVYRCKIKEYAKLIKNYNSEQFEDCYKHYTENYGKKCNMQNLYLHDPNIANILQNETGKTFSIKMCNIAKKIKK